jgi:hypothetical protein
MFKTLGVIYVSTYANPIGEKSSGYLTTVYDGNRLSLPVLRQKMAQSCYDVY